MGSIHIQAQLSSICLNVKVLSLPQLVFVLTRVVFYQDHRDLVPPYLVDVLIHPCRPCLRCVFVIPQSPSQCIACRADVVVSVFALKFVDLPLCVVGHVGFCRYFGFTPVSPFSTPSKVSHDHFAYIAELDRAESGSVETGRVDETKMEILVRGVNLLAWCVSMLTQPIVSMSLREFAPLQQD